MYFYVLSFPCLCTQLQLTLHDCYNTQHADGSLWRRRGRGNGALFGRRLIAFCNRVQMPSGPCLIGGKKAHRRPAKYLHSIDRQPDRWRIYVNPLNISFRVCRQCETPPFKCAHRSAGDVIGSRARSTTWLW